MTKILNSKLVVRISKHNFFLANCYTPNWSEEVFVIKKIKNTVTPSYVIGDLNDEEINGIFYEKDLQETSQTEFRVEKVIKRKCVILYVKRRRYDNLFNSWIIMKGIV